MTEEETSSTGAGTVFVDCAATAPTASETSSLEIHVADRSGFRVLIEGSCEHSLAKRKGTLLFRLLTDEDKLIPVSLKVMIVTEQAVSSFSLCAPHEKGVMVEHIFKPPAIRRGNLAFPISIALGRVFVLPLVRNE